jgi:hypothetical protein
VCSSDLKVIPTYILEELKQIELPIKNFKIVVSNICDFLSYLNIQFDNYSTSLLPISSEIFERHFNNRLYPKYKEILKDLNVLTSVPYEDGRFYSKEDSLSLQYRIHNTYLDASDFTLLIFDKNKKDMQLNIKFEGDRKFVNTIINESLDYAKVFKEEIEYNKKNNTSLFSLYIRLTKALSIQNERYLKMGDKSNRVYHSFSNLSRVTRKCFDTYFYNIDLKNSQPSMLALYMLMNNIPFDSQYQSDCENGLFYECFYDLRDVTTFTNKEAHRTEIKRQIYKSIFFSFNERSLFNKRMKALYPMTWQVLKDMNQWTEITVASLLQNTEADIFNNLKIENSTKYYTLFDAVYYNNKKDTENIAKQILYYGIQRGIKFTLSYE